MDCTLPVTAVLRDAIKVIEGARLSIAVVVDEQRRIIGTISDGDVRRALLTGRLLDTPVSEIANRRPVTATFDLPDAYLRKLLLASSLEAIPIVDAHGQFERVVHVSQLTGAPAEGTQSPFSAAVVMAGGEGQRLRPLTEATPKPMIDVGGVPLLERQVISLRRAGVKRIFIAINYLGHKIEAHFGDGSGFDVEISYLREPKKMGTGGALSLLPETTAGSILVMNADIVTRSDFNRLGAFHVEHGASITVGATQHDVDIPFGVLVVDGDRVTALREKPSQRFLCNAGIYALSHEVLARIPRGTPIDMPDLITLCIREGQKVLAFPIYEFWSDIGTVRDLEFARRNLGSV